LYRFRTRGGRGQKRQDECSRNDQPYKLDEGENETFQHDAIPCDPPLVGPGSKKVHVPRYSFTG
jgi:hypothetical protein